MLIETIKLLNNYLSTYEDNEWDVKHYSKEDDFKCLWGIGENKKLSNKVLIIWDGFPPDETSSLVNFKQYLTPIDWAVAYAYKFSNEDNKSPLEVVIVDIYSHRHVFHHIDLYNFFLQNLQCVKFYSFNDNKFKETISPLELLSGTEKIKNENNVVKYPASKIVKYFDSSFYEYINKQESSHSKGQDSRPQQNIKYLSWLWQRMLVESGQNDATHHSINNVLGPIILSKTYGSSETQDIHLLRGVFKRCIEWHGIIKGPEVSNNEEQVLLSGDEKSETNEESNQALQNNDTKLVLLDDQAREWEEVVNFWFDSDVQIFTEPDKIIDALDKKLTDNQRFSLHFTENQDEILLFDLYLYAKGSNNEKEYFKQVANMAEKNNNEGRTKIDVPDIKKLKDNNTYKKFLTLLPRLISEIDPTIPIIIFSATGDRAIIDEFNGYDNIITCFEKPRVSGYLNVDADVIHGKFEDAIKQAQDFIHVRRRFRKLLDYPGNKNNSVGGASSKAVSEQDNNDERGSEKIYIELYIDETGSPGEHGEFTVGGVYAIHKIKANADQFNNDLSDKGVYHFKLPDIKTKKIKFKYPAKNKEEVRTKDNTSKQLNLDDFFNLWNPPNDQSFFCGIKLTCLKKINEFHGKHNHKYALNLTMLRCLIELFLYEVLPSIGIKRNECEIAIYVATRVQPNLDPKEDKAQEKDFRYGIEHTGYPNFKSKYITSNTPHLFMREVHLSHNEYNPYIEDKKDSEHYIHRLIGVTLAYDKILDYDKPRHTKPGPDPQWEIKSKDGEYRVFDKDRLEELKKFNEDDEKGLNFAEQLKKKFRKKGNEKDFKIATAKQGLVPLQRPMHYIADNVLTKVEGMKELEKKREELFTTYGGMEETYDEDKLSKFINASRFLDQKKYFDALKEVITVAWPDVNSKEPIEMRGRKYILARLGKKALPEISNEDVYNLVATDTLHRQISKSP